MKILRPITTLAASAALMTLVPASAALAQRQPPTPEQRLDRLERQVQEMQRRVYPKGSPADTAGYSDEPAATQASVLSLSQRLDSLERQMADMLRMSEENGNRLRGLETSIGQMRSDEQQRIQALEQRMDAAAAAAAPAADAGEGTTSAAPVKSAPVKSRSSTSPSKTTASAAADDTPQSADTAAADPGEDAYSQGFHLWEAGKYDDAISTLKAFVSAYPKHPRVSYANNLIGRALLDKGQPRQAAEALLANYRGNPSGARAPDSLYYLGQALSELGQTTQACKAYAELDAVYGAKIRPDLKKLETDAKGKANCP